MSNGGPNDTDDEPPTPLVVGVVGGMGPMATVEMFRRLTDATPAERDQDHLHVIIDSDPAVPDRTEAVFGRGPSPLPWLQASAARLVEAGAGVLAMPCNTAHAYHHELQATTPVPVIHMIRETGRLIPARSSVGLLASDGTAAANLYQDELQRVGIDVIAPDAEAQRRVHEAIYLVKSGGDLAAASVLLEGVARELVRLGADGLVLACTEISLVADSLERVAPTVDAMHALVTATIEVATGTREWEQPGASA